MVEIKIIIAIIPALPAITCQCKKKPRIAGELDVALKNNAVNPIPKLYPTNATNAAWVRTKRSNCPLVTPKAFIAANCFRFSITKI